MSIKSFFSKIWAAVKSLFNQFPADVKAAVHVAVTVTENVKMFIDSPAADVFTVIIPGDIDDTLKQLLRAGLPVIVTKLKLADKCANESNAAEIIKCAINVLQSLDKGIKSAFLHNLSVMIAQIASDGKLTWSDAVCVVEWYYKNNFKPVDS